MSLPSPYSLAHNLSNEIQLVEEFQLDGNYLMPSQKPPTPFAAFQGFFCSANVAVFQGTFDPPTLTHLMIVKALLPHFAHILVYPTNKNSKKTPIALAHRAIMVRIGADSIDARRIHVVLCTRQPPFPKFVAGLRHHFGGDYAICQGIEKLLDLPWYADAKHESAWIRSLSHALVPPLGMNQVARANAQQILESDVIWIDIENQDRRSSRVREMLRKNSSSEDLSAVLSPEVYSYITTTRCYAS